MFQCSNYILLFNVNLRGESSICPAPSSYHQLKMILSQDVLTTACADTFIQNSCGRWSSNEWDLMGFKALKKNSCIKITWSSPLGSKSLASSFSYLFLATFWGSCTCHISAFKPPEECFCCTLWSVPNQNLNLGETQTVKPSTAAALHLVAQNSSSGSTSSSIPGSSHLSSDPKKPPKQTTSIYTYNYYNNL